MSKWFVFLVPLALVTLIGCTDDSTEPPRHADADVNVAHVTAVAVEHLVGTLRAPLDTNKPLIVTTVANIDDLNISSTLGRLISEQVAASLGKDGYTVTEVRLRKTMLANQQGEFMLSRDWAKLVPAHDAQAVVTGTYAEGPLWINVILKVVRLSDGKIIATVSYRLPNGPNTHGLISDATYTEGM